MALSFSVYSKMVSEKMKVSSIIWNEKKAAYEVAFEMHAAKYFSPKEQFSCLHQSLQKQQEVSIEFETKTGMINKCQ